MAADGTSIQVGRLKGLTAAPAKRALGSASVNSKLHQIASEIVTRGSVHVPKAQSRVKT